MYLQRFRREVSKILNGHACLSVAMVPACIHKYTLLYKVSTIYTDALLVEHTLCDHDIVDSIPGQDMQRL